MKRHLHRIFGLHAHRSIWIGEEELGRETEIVFKRKRYAVKIPARIDRKTILRLIGLGRIQGNQTGDLLLHIWLNKGADIHKILGMPAFTVPYATADEANHAPNENLELWHFLIGIKAGAAMLTCLG